MSTPATPAIPDRLKAGSSFAVSGSIKSPNGDYVLVLQSDGNFVVYAPAGRPLWATNTNDWGAPKPKTCILETDGNLRLLDHHGNECWSSGTGGQGNADSLLIIEDDGNVVINTDGKIIWSTNTSQTPPPSIPSSPAKPTPAQPVVPPAPAPTSIIGLAPGAALLVGQTMQSPNGNFQVSLLPSGNVQWRNVSLNMTVVYTPVTSAAQDAHSLTLNGNDLKLEIFDTNNTRLWKGGSRHPALNQTYPPPGPDGLPQLNGDPGLIIDNDGNIFIRDGGGLVLWKIDDLCVSVGDSLTPGMTLNRSQALFSTTGGYLARINSQGNFILVLKNAYDGFLPAETLWTAGTTNAETAWVTEDGNLCVGTAGTAAWSSNTGGHSGQGAIVLVVQPDGNMCIYAGGTCIFQTNTAQADDSD